MKTLLTLTIALGLLAGSAFAQTAPTLIPFQGRLTDQNGVAYTNNQYTIVFQLYDQAVGGTLLWSERHEKVGVINGMVNVFLGSIASLTNVTFSATRYLGITVDGDNNPNTPDPEMVPRQMIIPAFYAKTAENATKLAGYDWTPLFGVNNPSGGISGAKISPGTVTGTTLANGAVSTGHIASSGLAFTNIASRFVGTNAPAGGIAMSQASGVLNFSPSPVGTPVAVTSLTVTLATTGRPVMLGMVGSGVVDVEGSVFSSNHQNPNGTFHFVTYKENGVPIFTSQAGAAGNGWTTSVLTQAPGAFLHLYVPSVGTKMYSIEIRCSGASMQLKDVRFIAFEL